jgi:ADP-ribosylglycohydrolase
MALCLCNSLLIISFSLSFSDLPSSYHKGTFDPLDQIERYRKWWKEGYLSSTGKCFDIGNQTKCAITRTGWRTNPLLPIRSDISGRYYLIATSLRSSNGCIMRLAPIPLFYRISPETAILASALRYLKMKQFLMKSSRTTHSTVDCLDACKYMTAVILGALGGCTKEEILSENFSPIVDFWKLYFFSFFREFVTFRSEISPGVERIAKGKMHFGNSPFTSRIV